MSEVNETNTESTTSSISNPSSAAPARRPRRRVVRQAGAAGAALPIDVKQEGTQEVTLEIKQEIPAAQPTITNQTVAQSTQSTRSTRATSAARAAAQSLFLDPGIAAPVKAGEVSEASALTESTEKTKPARSQSRRVTRPAAAPSATFSDAASARKITPAAAPQKPVIAPRSASAMTSLLFKEPVLPVIPEFTPESKTASKTKAAAKKETPRKSNSRSSRVNRDSLHDIDHEAAESATASDATRTSGANTAGSTRSRSHRLNPEERIAAAEVGYIEEDLRNDTIEYADIVDGAADYGRDFVLFDDGETEQSGAVVEGVSSDTDEDSSIEHLTRRKRTSSRNKAKAKNGKDESAESVESNESEEGSAGGLDRIDDDEQITLSRRRRHRHGSGESTGSAGSSSKSELSQHSTSGKSRKQQYIDEITDIEGSTRLEAKKQRRRENRRDRSRQTLITEQDFLARRESVDRQMVVREKERHTQISVIEDNILVEHYVSDIDEVSTVGNVYLGRVQNVLPSMEAAFVDIGLPRNGVLYAGEVNWDTARLEGIPRRMELAYHSGDPVLVQVTKDPIGHKGARLTSQVTLAGRYIVLVPAGGMTGVSRKLPERERTRLKKIVDAVAPKDMGVIIRTAAEGASQEAIEKDCAHLVSQWESISEQMKKAKRSAKPKLLKGEPDVAIRVVRDIFNDDFRRLTVQGDGVYERLRQYLETTDSDLLAKLEKWDPAENGGNDIFDRWQIDSQLRKGMERQVYLPSGGSLVIDRTEAMTTVDVNTGRFIGQGRSLEETVTRCNLEAAEEIVRQLRLRDIGGMVMIDFVDMVLEANRDLVLRRLMECLSRDRTKHQVAEVTSLGIVQMTRKRVGQGLVEAFSEECPTCHGRGFILHDEPTISTTSADPYEVKGGDPFIETKRPSRSSKKSSSASSSAGSSSSAGEDDSSRKASADSEVSTPAPSGSSPEVKAKLAAIAAAAVSHHEEVVSAEKRGETSDESSDETPAEDGLIVE